MIQHLLREAGSEGIDEELVSAAAEGLEAQADWMSLGSPRPTSVTSRGRTWTLPDGVAYDEPRSYVAPESLQLNTWALAGNWTIEGRACVLNEARGTNRLPLPCARRPSRPALRERARPSGSACWSTAQRPGAAHGLDVDEEGWGTLVQPRLYQLKSEHGSITDRTFEVAFFDAGVEAYVFTFG